MRRSEKLGKYKSVYDRRWQLSKDTPDDDILALENPKTQVEFFYYNYNRFISDKLKEAFGDCRGRKLLELGCGRATSSIFQALNLGVKIYPTDYSEAALAIARKNVKKYGLKASFKQADLYAMPFEGGFFDAIISLGVMEHIDEPKMAYREMYRLLKKDGVMISMNVPEHADNIQRVAGPVNRVLAVIEKLATKSNSKPWLDAKSRSKTADVYRSELYGEDFAKIVESAGFSDVEVMEANPFPTFDPVPKILDRLIVKTYEALLPVRKILYGLDESFACGPRNSRVHFIVARKRGRK